MPRARSRQQRRARPVDSVRTASSRRWLATLLAAAFAVKVMVIMQLRNHPLLQPDAGVDTTAYVELARRVLGGDLLLGPGLYYLSPLYIYFLAAALTIADSFTFVRVLQAALGTCALAWIFITARTWSGLRAAWVAVGLGVFTGLFTFYEVLLLQASLDTFFTAAGLGCLTLALTSRTDSHMSDRQQVRAARRGRNWMLAAGVIFGLQALNRPNILIAAGGIALILILVRGTRPAIWLLAGTLIAFAPVVVRNRIVAHEWALLSSQGGLNFYIGNNEKATGQYTPVAGVRADVAGQAEDTRRVAEQAAGHQLTDSEVSRYFTRLALDWIRSNPAKATALFARKMALVFNAQHQWLDFSYPYYARDLHTWLRALLVGPWLLVPLGLTGLLVVWPEHHRAEYAVWAAFVPCYAVSVAVFFVAERYRLPILVPLCVSAGAAVDRVVNAIASRHVRTVAIATVVFLTLGVLASWRFHLQDGRFDERLRLAKVLMNRGQYDLAVAELTEAHRLDPGHSIAEFTLGMALVSDRRPAEGVPHVQHAIESGVPIDGARYALVRAMQVSGDTAGAARLLRTYTPAATDSAESCFQVALLAGDIGAPDVAERYLREALHKRPEWGSARQRLGLVLIDQHRYSEASAELRAALDAGSRDAITYANLAYCEAKLGRLAEARRLAQTAHELDPKYDLSAVSALIGEDR